RAIELALIVGKASDEREHTPRPRIHHGHRTAHFRHLAQPILIAFLIKRLDVDDIAGLKDLCNAWLSAAWRVSHSRFHCPLHAVEGKNPALPLLGQDSAGLAHRLQTDASGLIARLKHNSQSPWSNVGKRFHVAKLGTPVAGKIELGDGPPPASRL